MAVAFVLVEKQEDFMPTKNSNDNASDYEEGARVPKPGRSRRPDPIHTGDKSDEPKEPYGLIEPREDRRQNARHDDGVMPSGKPGT